MAEIDLPKSRYGLTPQGEVFGPTGDPVKGWQPLAGTQADGSKPGVAEAGRQRWGDGFYLDLSRSISGEEGQERQQIERVIRLAEALEVDELGGVNIRGLRIRLQALTHSDARNLSGWDFELVPPQPGQDEAEFEEVEEDTSKLEKKAVENNRQERAQIVAGQSGELLLRHKTGGLMTIKMEERTNVHDPYNKMYFVNVGMTKGEGPVT